MALRQGGLLRLRALMVERVKIFVQKFCALSYGFQLSGFGRGLQRHKGWWK
jgi:hypothetical protein